MTRNAGVGRRHDAAPLVTHGVEIGMADAAKEDFDLHVLIRDLTSFDRIGNQGAVALAAE